MSSVPNAGIPLLIYNQYQIPLWAPETQMSNVAFRNLAYPIPAPSIIIFCLNTSIFPPPPAVQSQNHKGFYTRLLLHPIPPFLLSDTPRPRPLHYSPCPRKATPHTALKNFLPCLRKYPITGMSQLNFQESTTPT